MDKLDFLNNVFLENEIKDYLVFILILLFGYILISPISSYLRNIIFRIVGNKNQILACVGIVIAYSPKRNRIIFGCVDPRCYDRLVAPKACGFVHGMRVASLELEVAFAACYKKSGCLLYRIKSGEIHITAIHQIEGARLNN